MICADILWYSVNHIVTVKTSGSHIFDWTNCLYLVREQHALVLSQSRHYIRRKIKTQTRAQGSKCCVVCTVQHVRASYAPLLRMVLDRACSYSSLWVSRMQDAISTCCKTCGRLSKNINLHHHTSSIFQKVFCSIFWANSVSKRNLPQVRATSRTKAFIDLAEK